MSRCRKPISVRATWLLGWLLLAGGACADEPQKLDEFLARLGLAELRLHNIERQLHAETDAGKKSDLSKSLVDRYVESLLAAADDTERFAALRGKVEALITVNPAARTAELDLVLLQAEYQQAEAAIIAWQEDAASASGLAQAASTLARIQPLLTAHQETLTAAADKTADTFDNLKTEQERQAADRQLARQRTLAARADYFAGWSAYYLGISRGDSRAAKADYEQARLHLARLLEITMDDDYKLVQAEELGLQSVWRARAVIGLGLSEMGLERVPVGTRVLAWLNHAAVNPSVREQETYWRLRGLLNAELWPQAAGLATSEVNNFTSTPSPGKSSFCVTAIRAGARLEAGPAQRTLVMAGVMGLARLRQFDALDKLIKQYKLDAGELGSEFQLTWIRGRRQYLAAEKSRGFAKFQAAASTLTSALDSPTARDHPQEAAQARYYLAWAQYRLGELDSAAQLFAEAGATLRAANPEIAAQALWMRATCLVERAQKDSRQSAAAVTALQSFKQEFPSSPEAERIDLIVARLRQTHTAGEESLQELSRVKPDDPTYVSARFEMCRIQHQLWSKARGDAVKSRGLAADLIANVQQLLSMADVPPDYRLKAALLAVDALRHKDAAAWSSMDSLLDRVAADVERMPTAMTARVEYEYRRLELAQHRDEPAKVQQYAAWIAQHGAGTPYELPALIVVARNADRAVTNVNESERTEALKNAHHVYDRLVTLLGETPADLASSKNAVAAAVKLAQYDEALARWPAAAERFSRLVSAQPNDRRLLRGAALANFQAGRYAESLAHWRTLLAGLGAGSDEWLEAKYFQIACLQKTDPRSASKVFSQFQVLYPDVKSPTWQAKFEALHKTLQ